MLQIKQDKDWKEQWVIGSQDGLQYVGQIYAQDFEIDNDGERIWFKNLDGKTIGVFRGIIVKAS